VTDREIALRRRELEASVAAGRRELARALGDLERVARNATAIRDLVGRHRWPLLLATFAIGVGLGRR
jgi:hypothetical protein